MTAAGLTAAKPGLIAASSTVILAAGGLNQIGAIGGVLGGAAGLIGTYIALRANARTARREYQQEMEAAEKRGRDSMSIVVDNLNSQLTNVRTELAESKRETRDAKQAAERWMQTALGRGPGEQG